MKKFSIISIFVMVVAIAVAVVSCKKDSPNAMLNSAPKPVKTFSPPKVDDMNAYLKDFKQRMQSATREDIETLSLEEAAWHLSSVANYDFANANVPFNDIRFDTLYNTVAVTNGSVLLSDLSASYDRISSDIDKFYHNLTLEGKHFRFINADISEEGIVTMSLVTTFIRSSRYLEDTLYYYDDIWDLEVECGLFRDEYEALPASTLGRSQLERFLNWKISHIAEVRYYYTATCYEEFYYRDEIDSYGSPNYMNSRLFANDGGHNMDIKPRFCYLCDSNLELGASNCPSGLYLMYWRVYDEYEPPFTEYHERFWKEHYRIKVAYGEKHEYHSEPGQNDD